MFLCYFSVVIYEPVKYTFLLFLLVLLNLSGSAANKVTFDAQLEYSIKNKQQYALQKQKRILDLKRVLSGDIPEIQQYDFNKRLYKEYRKYKLDSAIYFVKRNIVLAKSLKNSSFKDEAQIQLANLYSSSGKYRESEIILKSINRNTLSKDLLPRYYEAYSQFFEHYVTNSFNQDYFQYIEIYRDSLLNVLDPHSIKYQINLAQKNIYRNKINTAQKDLLRLFNAARIKDADYAMYAYLLGDIYGMKKDFRLKKKFYTIAAITDITNVIKDNAAIQSLSLIYYEEGDIDKAYQCTKSAIEDAIFCNVKFRTIHISELYSIINTAYLDKEAKQKEQLKIYLILISILSLFLILAVVYVYKQMRKVSRIKEELHQTGQKLAELNIDISTTNEQLNGINSQLYESNRIKEEYIAHFFDLCSAYIKKLEDYRKALNRKASDKQLDELFKMLKSTTVVDNELEQLYKNFDTIFINLYPTFVRDFNSLLVAEEQVVLKPGELLNTELRIFALVRLGITDSVKIAAFLRYSLSTIYNYRTKTRNKAAVSRDEFEIMVSRIGIIAGKSD